MANDSLGDVLSQVKEVNGVKVLASKVADVDMNGLRNLGDQLKDKIGRRCGCDRFRYGRKSKSDGNCNR